MKKFFRSFGRFIRLFQKTSKKPRVIAVMDFHEHTRGGHFGLWHCRFASEFARRFDKVAVITPNPELTEARFRELGSTPSPKITFHRLPSQFKKTFDLERLRKIEGLRKANLHAFIMWAYDLLDLAQPEVPSRIPWAAMSQVSWSKRGYANRAAELEGKLLDLYQTSRSFRIFVQPDQYLSQSIKNAVWIPDVEIVSLPGQSTVLAQAIHSLRHGRFCVGAFGILTGDRCLHEILELAKVQKEIMFVLAGRVLEETVRADLLPFLRDGALPNVRIIPGFLEEDQFNAAIQATDAVLIDGASYPVQSTVVCRAIHFGKCVIAPRSNSWSQDFINEWKVGVVYRSRDENLVAEWKKWRKDGGEARSRAASAAMRNPAKSAACFDAVTRALIQLI